MVVSANDTLCWEDIHCICIHIVIVKAKKKMKSWISRNLVSIKPHVLIPFYKVFVRTHLELRSAGVGLMGSLYHTLQYRDR